MSLKRIDAEPYTAGSLLAALSAAALHTPVHIVRDTETGRVEIAVRHDLVEMSDAEIMAQATDLMSAS